MPFICVLLRQEGRSPVGCPPSFCIHLLSFPYKRYLQCPSILSAGHFLPDIRFPWAFMQNSFSQSNYFLISLALSSHISSLVKASSFPQSQFPPSSFQLYVLADLSKFLHIHLQLENPNGAGDR